MVGLPRIGEPGLWRRRIAGTCRKGQPFPLDALGVLRGRARTSLASVRDNDLPTSTSADRLVECLRWIGIGAGTLPTGWLAGLRDPALAAALRTMHGDVGNGWTVARLAGIAGMSRSAFAARFVETVGCGPIEYLSRWRMALARDALDRGGMPLDRLAEAIGYDSASAFSTAFRRRTGCSPGAFARDRRLAAAA